MRKWGSMFVTSVSAWEKAPPISGLATARVEIKLIVISHYARMPWSALPHGRHTPPPQAMFSKNWNSDTLLRPQTDTCVSTVRKMFKVNANLKKKDLANLRHASRNCEECLWEGEGGRGSVATPASPITFCALCTKNQTKNMFEDTKLPNVAIWPLWPHHLWWHSPYLWPETTLKGNLRSGIQWRRIRFWRGMGANLQRCSNQPTPKLMLLLGFRALCSGKL